MQIRVVGLAASELDQVERVPPLSSGGATARKCDYMPYCSRWTRGQLALEEKDTDNHEKLSEGTPDCERYRLH